MAERRRVWLLPLAAALASAGIFAGGGPAGADSPLPAPLPALSAGSTASSLSADALEAALLVKLNAERAAAGLPGLTVQPWAASVARAHSQDMATARDIWHNHTGFLDIARQAIDAYVDGENVAEAGTLDEADALLMSSPPHRANILYPLFNEVGIGVALDSAGYVYVTQDFVDIRLPQIGAGAATPAVAKKAAPASSAARPAPAAPAAVAAAPAPAAVPLADPDPPAASAPRPAASPKPTTAPPATTVASTKRRPGPALAPLGAVVLAALTGGVAAAAYRRRWMARTH